MQQKIEWYKEVLELEPGSRVFFPLAKLLAKQKKYDEAVNVLEKGLLNHPDHIEARLQLIEYLALNGSEHKAQSKTEELSKLLCSYPLFLQEWSKVLGKKQEMYDASLALRFFVLAIQGAPLSWAKVLSEGINASVSTQKKYAKFLSHDSFEAHTGTLENEDLDLESNDYTLPKAVQQETAENDAYRAHGIKKTIPLSEEQEELFDQDFLDNDEEPFSLRTRSMAEVLAEQGDYAGAVDIYSELLSAAPSSEKNGLQQRLEELHEKLNASPSTPVKSEENIDSSANHRLTDLLESLAQSLEERSYS